MKLIRNRTNEKSVPLYLKPVFKNEFLKKHFLILPQEFELHILY